QAFLAERELEGHWRASTVHAQQGGEADVVIFDAVHASSTAWDEVEWRRLINVGLSRARASALFIASREELRQPFIAPLVALMGPHRLARGALEPMPLEALGRAAPRLRSR